MSWSAERAEEHLLSLELFGMRFGLDRVRRLLTALGSPQRAFRSIHVVGTNGKSSTTRYAAAILEAHGVRAGAYLSPHLTAFTERIRIGDADLPSDAFGAAVQRAAAAAQKVDRTLEAGDRVTQFELLTAAALSELARAGVEVAVVEAGLGGRHDATNVLDAEVVALTNVGLEHTRWLGPTVEDIAREKLAVLTPGATLVLGAVDPAVADEAREAAERVGAPVIRAVGGSPPAGGAVAAGELVPGLPSFQRANVAVATAAVGALLGRLDEDAARRAVERVVVPGRFQQVSDQPLTIVDGAHNPAGIAALVDALPHDRALVAVVSILDDKDAAAMLRLLLPRCTTAVFTTSTNPRALSPATLESLAGQLGGPPTEREPDPRRALQRARELAGKAGAVIVTGSIYLVADLLSAPGARRASML